MAVRCQFCNEWIFGNKHDWFHITDQGSNPVCADGNHTAYPNKSDMAITYHSPNQWQADTENGTIVGPQYTMDVGWNNLPNDDSIPYVVEIAVISRTAEAEPYEDDDGMAYDGHLRMASPVSTAILKEIEGFLNKKAAMQNDVATNTVASLVTSLGTIEAYTHIVAENIRLRAVLDKIANCPNPDSVSDCHDKMSEMAAEALDA